MKKLIITITSLCSIWFASCTEISHKIKKPFIVFGKTQQTGYVRYQYQDADGFKYTFEETKDKYNVGDTLR